MFSNRSVNVHQFSMIPRADIPRSAFVVEHTHKTALDAGYLYPIYAEEVLPGDSMRCNMTAFARLATPLFPIMDNLHFDSFFIFVPYRLVWTNWVKMMGEQDNPGDSISYSVPQIVSPVGGYAIGTIYDYLGLPTVGQVGGGNTITHSALPLRAYNLIYKEWFRTEYLQNSPTINKGDGPDTYTDYTLLRRGKRHDYFTAALPWPQKGAAVSVPLGTSAPVYGTGKALGVTDGTTYGGLGGSGVAYYSGYAGNNNANVGAANSGAGFPYDKAVGVVPAGYVSGLYADLTSASAATVNQLRQSFQIQRLLERDARGGTRYTEQLWVHFGVRSPDARLQRPEYLGGSSQPITISPIAQTSGTSASGTTTPLGNLAAMGTMVATGHGFSQSFVEHGIVLGLVSIRADLTYQQGMARWWNRLTRYDFYYPVFAHLGEQTILNKEIYCKGDANDALVFGYQERWSEYRNHPSQITSLFRSTAAGTIDAWHLAQKFSSLPTLNDTFIKDTPPVDRIVAVGAGANGQQFILDTLFRNRMVRPMPLYSVPGLIDHL